MCQVPSFPSKSWPVSERAFITVTTTSGKWVLRSTWGDPGIAPTGRFAPSPPPDGKNFAQMDGVSLVEAPTTGCPSTSSHVKLTWRLSCLGKGRLDAANDFFHPFSIKPMPHSLSRTSGPSLSGDRTLANVTDRFCWFAVSHAAVFAEEISDGCCLRSNPPMCTN